METQAFVNLELMLRRANLCILNGMSNTELELKTRIERLYEQKKDLQIEIDTVELMLSIVARTVELPVSDWHYVDTEQLEETKALRVIK